MISKAAQTAPTLWIVGGANGVGKTTFATAEIQDLSGSASFVNLDLIAQGISPLDPNLEQIRAARIALDLMRAFIARAETFSIETTLAGRGHKGLIAEARKAGYSINLLYFFVSTPEQALDRIAKLVARGGHDVPTRDALRRYSRSLAQFADYAQLCDLWRIYDTDEPTPRLRASGKFTRLNLRPTAEGPPLPPAIGQWVGALKMDGD